jgi:quercetin dioxygenase-like cupin family protein
MTLPTHVPQGEYPHQTPVHYIDLETEADRLVSELPGYGRRSRNLAREGGISIVLMAMESGDRLAQHSSDGTVIIQVLRGQVSLTANGHSQSMRDGEAALLQPNIKHDIAAEEQSVVVLTVASSDK